MTIWFIIVAIEIQYVVVVKHSITLDCKLSLINFDQYLRRYSGEQLTHQTSDRWTFFVTSEEILVVPHFFSYWGDKEWKKWHRFKAQGTSILSWFDDRNSNMNNFSTNNTTKFWTDSLLSQLLSVMLPYFNNWHLYIQCLL